MAQTHPRLKRLAAAFFAGLALASRPAGVGAQDSRPAGEGVAASAPAQSLRLHVTRVIGKVQYRTPDNPRWQQAQEGLDLPEGTEFSTLPLSRVQFTIPPDQTFAIDRVTRVKITKASFQNGKLITDAGMPFGRVRYDIQGAGIEHDATVRSPNATLAVRGTDVSLYDQPPYTPRAISLTGTARFRYGLKSLAFGAKGAGKVTINTASNSPAELALSQAVVDPALQRARTSSEQTLIAQFVSRGAVTFFDTTRGIQVIRGGTPPSAEALARTLPGLDIFLSWTGNANLDLSVGAQMRNEFLYPIGGLNSRPNGDKIPFDHQGGPKGGIELANFPTITDPNTDEVITVGATHISGKPANMTFSVFMNGKQLSNNIFDFASLSLVTTLSGTLQQGQANSAIVPLGPEKLIFGGLNGNPFPPPGGGNGNPFPPPGQGFLLHHTGSSSALPRHSKSAGPAENARIGAGIPAWRGIR